MSVHSSIITQVIDFIPEDILYPYFQELNCGGD